MIGFVAEKNWKVLKSEDEFVECGDCKRLVARLQARQAGENELVSQIK